MSHFIRAAVGDDRIANRLLRSGSLADIGREGPRNQRSNPPPVLWFEAGRSIGTVRPPESRFAQSRAQSDGQSACLCDFDIHRRCRRRDPCCRHHFQLASLLDVRCGRSHFDWSRERLWRLLGIIWRRPSSKLSSLLCNFMIMADRRPRGRPVCVWSMLGRLLFRWQV